MAKAVENASVISMRVNEKYRQSLNCQAEAQYSFRLKDKSDTMYISTRL